MKDWYLYAIQQVDVTGSQLSVHLVHRIDKNPTFQLIECTKSDSTPRIDAKFIHSEIIIMIL